MNHSNTKMSRPTDQTCSAGRVCEPCGHSLGFRHPERCPSCQETKQPRHPERSPRSEGSLFSWVSLATIPAATLFLLFSLSGCSGPTESESQMTSFTSTESKSDTAELFSVPKEQMSHIQVVAAQKAPLARTLRLTGSVAYDAFATTPVFAAIGGPVHEILVAPGESVQAGQPLLTVTSPDYSAARSAYIKGQGFLPPRR